MPDQTSNQSRGSGELVVRGQTCLLAIADETGHVWQTIWDHADNADLKSGRKDPRVLLAGDRLHIPPIETKQESGATEKRHTFRRLGVPAKFRLRVLDEGEPMAALPWTADVGAGGVISGTTADDGLLEFPIPPGATRARIEVGEGSARRSFLARLGALDPVDTPTGVRQRLANLGMCRPGPARDIDPSLRLAIRKFQRLAELEVTGDADRATLDELLKRHGS